MPLFGMNSHYWFSQTQAIEKSGSIIAINITTGKKIKYTAASPHLDYKPDYPDTADLGFFPETDIFIITTKSGKALSYTIVNERKTHDQITPQHVELLRKHCEDNGLQAPEMITMPTRPEVAMRSFSDHEKEKTDRTISKMVRSAGVLGELGLV